jgi:hypothetical protein
MSNSITRPDGSIVRTYAPGDGHLSYGVTDTEASHLCPPGWTVYRDGPYHRARPAQNRGN